VSAHTFLTSMPLVILHHLLNVFVQLAKKKKRKKERKKERPCKAITTECCKFYDVSVVIPSQVRMAAMLVLSPERFGAYRISRFQSHSNVRSLTGGIRTCPWTGMLLTPQ
jgi:hypothetical protein